MSESDSDMSITQPPERRETSTRAGRGNRMSRLIAEEEDEEAEDGDKDFYEQDFWADAEEDVDFQYNGDVDNSDRGDSFDSDFAESDDSESEDDDDDEEAVARKAKAPKKKSVYKDPKLAHKKGTVPEAGSSSSAMLAPKPPKKRRAPSMGLDLAPIARSKRKGTEESTIEAAARRKAEDEAAKERRERVKEIRKGNIILRRLTQEEILSEAVQTEIINRASYERMLSFLEEKRKVERAERLVTGPRMVYHSRREPGEDTVTSTVTWVDTPVPKAIDGIAPPYPPPQRCAVTGLPAKYFDPQTQLPYATLDAFRKLRGLTTGRRQHSYGAAGPSSSGAAD